MSAEFLDPNARIFGDADTLHVVHRRGHFELRGKNITKLHERFVPLLQRGIVRQRVLEQVGTQSPVVARYLDGLHDAGALTDRQTHADLPRDFPRAHASTQILPGFDREIVVHLCATEIAPGSPIEICFVHRALFERWLFTTHWDALTGRRLWVICDTAAEDAELQRRAAIARYLLANALGRESASSLRIFELDPQRLILRSLVPNALAKASLTELFSQLGCVRTLDAPQLPLVTWSAHLPGTQRRLIGYGLNAEDVAHSITLLLAGRETLLHAVQRGTATGSIVRMSAPRLQGDPADVAAWMVSRATFATTRWQCICDCLPSWASVMASNTGAAVDLLSLAAPSRRVAILQDALRLRRESLPGTLDERLDPVLVFRSKDFTVARFGLEETLCDALVQGLMREFGCDTSDAVTCIAQTRRTPRLARDFNEASARLPPDARAIVGRVSVCGTEIHFAIPMLGRSA